MGGVARGAAQREPFTELCVMFTSLLGGSLIPSGHCAGRRGPAGPPAAPRRATARTLPPRQSLTEQNYTVSASVTDFKLKCRAGTVTVTDSNLKFQTQRILNTK